MSKYEELCSALKEQSEAERNYWQALQLRAAQIAGGLCAYLEFPSRGYEDVDGKVFPYVVLTKPGEDKECHFMHLPGANAAVQFDLVVTLEEEPGCFPKSKVRFCFNIGSTGEVIRVWDNSGTIDTELPIGVEVNEDVYAQIFKALKTHLSDRTLFMKA